MKIYVLMPTYNDAETIVEALDSLFIQTYKNFELIIVDDGSSDNTKEIISNYKKDHDKLDQIKYIYQDNADQLNALKNAAQYITEKNSLVYILHSDDLLNDENVFLNTINYFKNNECDAIISDLNVIDKNSNLNGFITVNNYKNSKYIPALQLLSLGRNLYSDFSFSKSEVFLNSIYKNYLTWNGPFWLDVEEKVLLNVKKANFVFFKYRVFEENYINNNLGKLCVINGEIRVVANLLKHYYIPLYKVQYYISRLFNRLKLWSIYRPIYFNKETKNKYKIIKFILNKRFNDDEIKSNLYLNALLNFYKNQGERTIIIDKIPSDIKIYCGSDLRVFNRQIIEGTLPDFYLNILKEMESGFNKVIVKKEVHQKDEIIKLLRFLAIFQDVDVEFE